MKEPKYAGKYDGWMVGVASMSEDQNAANPVRPDETESTFIWTQNKGKSIMTYCVSTFCQSMQNCRFSPITGFQFVEMESP